MVTVLILLRGRKGRPPKIEDAKELAEKNQDGHSCNYKKVGERRQSYSGKTPHDPEYVAARLARDAETDAVAADVKARHEAGKLSAHAAAVEMGWRKQRTQLDKLKSAWRNADEDERAQFKDFIKDE